MMDGLFSFGLLPSALTGSFVIFLRSLTQTPPSSYAFLRLTAHQVR